METDVFADRYSVAEAFVRQAAGPVFDFLLSFGVASDSLAQALVIDKFRVASVPGLFSYEYDLTLGGYLAAMSARSFEYGHRIGGPGEIYYLADLWGVVVLAVASSAVVYFCDRCFRKAPRYFLELAILYFGVLFAMFIDISHIFTGIYMSIIVYLVRRVVGGSDSQRRNIAA